MESSTGLLTFIFDEYKEVLLYTTHFSKGIATPVLTNFDFRKICILLCS